MKTESSDTLKTEPDYKPVELIPKKKSKGMIFKKKHGYSLTLAKNMKKAGVKTIAEYKVVRKSRIAKQKKAKRDKNALSRANRGMGSTTKFTKSQNQRKSTDRKKK